jgi:hypothetical protein
MAGYGPLPRWRSPDMAAGYWGSSAATVALGPQEATMPRTAAGILEQINIEGSGGRIVPRGQDDQKPGDTGFFSSRIRSSGSPQCRSRLFGR